MSKILIIVDKFKGSMTAQEVCDTICCSFAKEHPEARCCSIPLADGGDGTIEAIKHFGSDILNIKTLDPLGREIEVPVLKIGKRVLCEMAKSTGLALLPSHERDPRHTGSYGFGLVIDKVAQMGHRDIILGIGGSATNDVGIGMLSALGFRFYNKDGKQIGERGFLRGRDLHEITTIDDTHVASYVRELKIEVACDVNNPLTGPFGASHVYGPQKGATPQIVEFLENGVVSFAKVSREWAKIDLINSSGSGAAGGMGYALALFLRAKLVTGWKLLFDLLEVEEHFANCDLVITGEGRVDGQSLSGKLLDGVLQRSNHHKKPVWVICGSNLLTERELEMAGISKLFSISHIEPIKELAIANGKEYLKIIATKAASEYKKGYNL